MKAQTMLNHPWSWTLSKSHFTFISKSLVGTHENRIPFCGLDQRKLASNEYLLLKAVGWDLWRRTSGHRFIQPQARPIKSKFSFLPQTIKSFNCDRKTPHSKSFCCLWNLISFEFFNAWLDLFFSLFLIGKYILVSTDYRISWIKHFIGSDVDWILPYLLTSESETDTRF